MAFLPNVLYVCRMTFRALGFPPGEICGGSRPGPFCSFPIGKLARQVEPLAFLKKSSKLSGDRNRYGKICYAVIITAFRCVREGEPLLASKSYRLPHYIVKSLNENVEYPILQIPVGSRLFLAPLDPPALFQVQELIFCQ